MPILDQWDLRLDADAVLRGQGAEPSILRTRRPHLVDVAAQALNEALPLVHPLVLYGRFPVEAIHHSHVRLVAGKKLIGEAISGYLAPAQEVVALVCTIGAELEEHTARVIETDMVRGLALYGAGSAAVEALANAACQYIEEQAAQQNLQTTVPLSPGMRGWSVEDGQPQIFSLLDGSQVGIKLTQSAIMVPLKSLSLILGIGADLNPKGTTCDYCTMRSVCRYQSDHVEAG